MFRASKRSEELSDDLTQGDIGFDGFPVSLNYFTAVPNLSAISNSKFAVVFKSLMKKDAITKEKSLNDLGSLIGEEKEYVIHNEAIVIAWIQLYAKLSIDNSRNIRILSHQIQAQFLGCLGGKSFSRFLRSSISSWLQGLFDGDKAVANASYKSLYESFRSDQKISTQIWRTFSDSILRYVDTVVSFENFKTLSDQRHTSKEDSIAKYERVLDGCIMMLHKLLTLVNEGEMNENENIDFNLLEGILCLEKLWDNLSVLSESDTLNSHLINSLLSLIQVLFSNSSNSESENLLASKLTNIKSIYKLVSRKFIKHVKLKSHKESSIDFLYSSFIVSFWITLDCLTKFPLISNVKIKRNIWQLGGSKGYSRLIRYMKLGYCRSSPLYYVALTRFLKTLSRTTGREQREDEIVVNFSSCSQLELFVFEIIIPQYDKIVDSNTKLACLNCITEIFKCFGPRITPDQKGSYVYDLSKLVDHLVMTTFNTLKRPVSKEIFRNFGLFLDSNFSEKEIEKALEETYYELTMVLFRGTCKLPSDSKMIVYESFILNVLELMSHIEKHKHLVKSLLSGTISLLESKDIFKSARRKIEFLAFFLIGIVNYFSASELRLVLEAEPLFSTINGFIEEDFINLPFELIATLIEHKDSLKELHIMPLINEYFSKFSAANPEKTVEFILLCKRSGLISLSTLKAQHERIYTYLIDCSHRKNVSDQQLDLLFSFISDQNIFKNVLTMFLQNQDTESKFLKKFETLQEFPQIYNLGDDLVIPIKQLLSYCYKNIMERSSKHFIKFGFLVLLESSIKSSIFEFVVTCSPGYNFQPFREYLQEAGTNTDLKTIIPLSVLEREIMEYIHDIETGILSIGNPLGYNLFICEGDDSHGFKLRTSPISIGSFCLELLNIPNFDIEDQVMILLMCCMAMQYINDYLFLSSHADLFSHEEEIHEIRSKIMQELMRVLSFTNFRDIFSIFNSPFNDIDHHPASAAIMFYFRLNTLLDSDQNVRYLQSYVARVHKLTLEHLIESEPLFSFKHVSNLNLDYMNSHPIRLAIFATAVLKYLPPGSFDTVRKFVTSEILGVKLNDILGKGVQLLCLSADFLSEELDYDINSIMPPHRLSLIINQFSAWLNLDFSFDVDFVKVRCLLAVLLRSLILNSETVSEKFLKFSYDLIVSNLEMAEAATSLLELRYFTFRLLIAIDGIQKSSRGSLSGNIQKAFLDVLINKDILKFDSDHENQALSVSYALVDRIIETKSLESNNLEAYLLDLYLVFSETTYIPLQKVLASLLNSVILADQQDLVIDYEMKQQSIVEEGETDAADESLNLSIPSTLLDCVHISQKNFEYVTLLDNYRSSRMAWSWFLILDHFKNVSFKMRQEYTRILRKRDLIEIFLDFVFFDCEILDRGFVNGILKKDMKDMDKISADVQDYSFGSVSSLEDIKQELQKLVVHLYYLMLVFLGSDVRSWFNKVRDLQAKLKIEKFTCKVMSPLIAKKILQEVINSKNKLTNGDEKMNIKVNFTTYEVRTVYTIDDQVMEMVIKIPQAYPLYNVSVEGPQRIGVKDQQWKAWLLASQKVITLANGSVVDAIELFTRNVNLHFSGFDECAICYSILHQDHSLPSKTCATCHNKFHASCLYKWFKSSGASTCPLCRSAFNFRQKANN